MDHRAGTAGRQDTDQAEPRVTPGLHTHGMGNSFRSWCSDTEQPRELAEQALASHVDPNRVEAPSMRSDLFERRREADGSLERLPIATQRTAKG